MVPASIPTTTGPSQLGVQIELLNTTAENGGSPILQYELQYDDGARGTYKSIFTLNPIAIIADGISSGLEYRLRYRAMNFNGWGEMSAIAYIIAAGLPQKPSAPLYISTNSTHAVVQLQPTADDRGGDISAYELYIDEIQTTPSYELVSTAMTMTRTFEFAPPTTATAAEILAWQTLHAGTFAANLVRGKAYRLVTKAVNMIGQSDASEELRIALGGLPAQPTAP